MSELLLDSLEIKGYRCFEHLTIEKLGRVNLIVGKNNVGKTALLEALWIWANGGKHIEEILNRRYEDRKLANYNGNGADIYKNLFNWKSTETKSFTIGAKLNRQQLIAELDISNKHFSFPKQYGGIEKKVFIRTDGLDAEKIILFWDLIELKPSEDYVKEALKEIIFENLIKVRVRNMQNGERIPFAQIEHLEEPLPLKSFGDGLNRLFGILLALVNCKDGILLIDEIENGFHYAVLPNVWKLIFKTAKDLNVQVLATTHSKDCLEAFTKAAIDDKESDGMLIRLERNKNDKIIAKVFNEENLETITRREIEVR